VPTFAVTTMQGPQWDTRCGIREQELWREHAEFADSLVDGGTVLLGGPVEDSDDRVIGLIAVRAADEASVVSVFADDPWVKAGILQLKEIRPWRIWLDSGGRRRVEAP
jgi:uncharacterized protein YciI